MLFTENSTLAQENGITNRRTGLVTVRLSKRESILELQKSIDLKGIFQSPPLANASRLILYTSKVHFKHHHASILQSKPILLSPSPSLFLDRLKIHEIDLHVPIIAAQFFPAVCIFDKRL